MPRTTNKGTLVNVQKSLKSFTDVFFDEKTLTLKATKTVSKYDIMISIAFDGTERTVSKTLIDKASEDVSFKLEQTNRADLLEYRKNRESCLVYKVQKDVYYCKIPPEMTFFPQESFGKHVCSLLKDVCFRLSAKSDDEGGCAKVRNRARGIEYYSWITKGFETFGTHKNVFIVCACKHYIPDAPKPQNFAYALPKKAEIPASSIIPPFQSEEERLISNYNFTNSEEDVQLTLMLYSNDIAKRRAAIRYLKEKEKEKEKEPK